MHTDYEIAKYTPQFRSQVVELQAHLWGPHLAVNTAYFAWKYERNPYVEAPLIYLALHKGEVVGMRGMYGARWEIGHPRQTWLGLCAGDTVIAPEHRKRGLSTEIIRAALNELAGCGYTYIFTLSASRITYLTSLAMGWRSLGPLQSMHKRSNRSLRARLLLLLGRGRMQRQAEATAHVYLDPRPRPEAMAELVERLGHDGRIRHVKDQQYFAWRFQNPFSCYRFLFWEDSRMDGYLVLQRKLYKDQAQVNIVDWEAANAQVRADLLWAAIHLGNFDGLTIWSATLSNEVKRLLRRAGFKASTRTRRAKDYLPTVLMRPLQHAMLECDWVLANRRLLDQASWDLHMIYSDSY
jgi:GNAT superfamily N-acetyltransferase